MDTVISSFCQRKWDDFLREQWLCWKRLSDYFMEDDGLTATTLQTFSQGSNPYGYGIGPMLNVNGSLFFGAFDAGYGGQGSISIWKTDGTPAGTVMLSSWGGGPPDQFTSVNGILYFTDSYPYNSDPNYARLWSTDGTPTGTGVVGSYYAHLGTYSFGAGAEVNSLVNINGALFYSDFYAADYTHLVHESRIVTAPDVRW